MSEHNIPDRTEATVREIIENNDLPEFVRGYDIRLDEFDGTKGFWVTFAVLPLHSPTEAEIRARGVSLVNMQLRLDEQFTKHVVDRFPFYRFAEVAASHTLA